MPKIFLPPLNSLITLSNDVTPSVEFVRYYKNADFLNDVGYPIHKINEEGTRVAGTWRNVPHQQIEEWRAAYNAAILATIAGNPFILPAGCIFSVERYHVSRSGEDRITLMLKDSPSPKFKPKKMGGLAKGKLRLYMSLDDFNLLGEVTIS